MSAWGTVLVAAGIAFALKFAGYLVLDARVGGLIAAFVALLLRAPFIVVVIVAAATAAGLRALGAS
jgi:hypothetical protein